MGVVHRPSPEWASHIPVLLKCLELSDGPVLELGMGDMSTPLLHTVCEATDRYLTSYDNDGRFIDRFAKFGSPLHEIELVDWDNLVLKDGWAVVLVDQKPAAQRKLAAQQLTESDYVLLHDSNATDDYYGFEEIYPLFKYRYDYKKLANWTTVLSNKHDVNQLYNS